MKSFTKHQAPSTKHQAPSTKHQAPSTKHQALTLILFFTLFFIPILSFAQKGDCASSTSEESYMGKLPKDNTTLSLNLDFQRSTAFGRFPNSGDINALVVFIKFKNENYEDLRTFEGYNSLGEPTFNETSYIYANDTLVGRKASGYADSWNIGGFQSWTDNPISEWPHNLPMINSRKQQLPNWANTSFIDDFNNSTTTSGSMTDILYRASNGMLNFRGQIYEWTYVPQLNSNEYSDMRVLVNEILDYIRNDSVSVVDVDNPAFDLIKSDSFDHGTDGIFDMLMLNFRYVQIKNLDTNWGSYPPLAGGITWLYPEENHPSPRSPFTNGNYVFNIHSGVINSSYSRQGMIGTAIHEIGHRLFGYHPIDGRDNFSIMQQTPRSRFHISILDKLVAGWGEVLEVDLSTQNEETNLAIFETYRINNSSEYDLIVLKRNASTYSGAVVIEAVHKNQPWLNNTDPNMSDGDGGDPFLPNEGLLIYKLSTSNSIYISSMHANGVRRTSTGINDYQAFGVGDAYTPFSIVSNYGFNGNANFDKEVAITEIVKTSTGFSFKVHKNFLTSSLETKKLTTRYSFNTNTIAKPINSSWQLGGRFILTKAVSLSNFTITSAPNTDWNGFLINESNGISNNNFYFSNATIAELKGNSNWSLYPGQAVISVYDGQLNLNNVNIHSTGTIAAIGTSGYYGVLTIVNSDIHTQQGTGILSTGNGIVYVRNSEISSSGTTYPLVQAKYGGMLSAWLPPWLYYGYQQGLNKLQGGSYGIEANNNSIVRFGEGSNSNNLNYFFDSNAKKIKVSSGGTAYVNYNYWNNNSPTLVNQGGTIYYNYSLGNAQGYILGSGGFMSANNENREGLVSSSSISKSEQDLESEKVDVLPWALIRDQFSFESQGKAQINHVEDELSRLSPQSKVLFQFYNEAIQSGLKNVDFSMTKEFSELDADTKSHILFTAIQSSLSQKDTAVVRTLFLQNKVQISESWKPVFDNLLSSIGTGPIRYRTEEAGSVLKTYPNPFNPSTTIQMEANSTGLLRLTIFNVLGQKILTYQRNVRATEFFNYVFDASKLASGLYIVQIELGQEKLNSKLYLIK